MTLLQPSNLTPEFGDHKIVRQMFSIGRSHLYKLGKEGKIKTVSLRERGKIKGRRLYVLDSIRDYLLRNIQSQEAS